MSHETKPAYNTILQHWYDKNTNIKNQPPPREPMVLEKTIKNNGKQRLNRNDKIPCKQRNREKKNEMGNNNKQDNNKLLTQLRKKTQIEQHST